MKVDLDEVLEVINNTPSDATRDEIYYDVMNHFEAQESVPCSCYKERITARPTTEFERGVYFARTGEMVYLTNDVQGVCTGTKEVETCTCGGDRRKCNFYKEKNK